MTLSLHRRQEKKNACVREGCKLQLAGNLMQVMMAVRSMWTEHGMPTGRVEYCIRSVGQSAVILSARKQADGQNVREQGKKKKLN